MRVFMGIGASVAAILAAGASAGTTQVMVTVENLSPINGTFQTPWFVGFHNGGFDMFDVGASASAALEALAEDGNVNPLLTAFNDSGLGSASGTVAPGGPFAPGASASTIFEVDSSSRYFSFASMIIPSNDAFIGNDDAMAYQVFDDMGNFTAVDFFITGAEVYDAGTEVNDELPQNTAFFGQMAPNTGVDENGVVHAHQGFNGSAGNPGNPGILGDPAFSGGDFTQEGYPIARVTISAVPGPGALAILAVAGVHRRRRRH